jgi:nucleotide-binding universal stress UspA family protein
VSAGISDASIRALGHALSLAKEADARLILLHVIEDVLGDVGAKAMGHRNVLE